jgi:hypothetical protein
MISIAKNKCIQIVGKACRYKPERTTNNPAKITTTTAAMLKALLNFSSSSLQSFFFGGGEVQIADTQYFPGAVAMYGHSPLRFQSQGLS